MISLVLDGRNDSYGYNLQNVQPSVSIACLSS